MEDSVVQVVKRTTVQGRAERQKRGVLKAIARDPCPLDLVVWAASPLVPEVLDRVFEMASRSIFEGPEGKSGRATCDSPEEPPLRWALVGPKEPELRRALARCEASLRWGGPSCMLPGVPMGPNPYIVAVDVMETSVLGLLASRAAVVLNASESEVPAALPAACSEQFADIIDASSAAGPRGPVEEIMNGTPRRRGALLRLAGDGMVPPRARALLAACLVRAIYLPARAESATLYARL
mmetsp:Transcript_144125/g.254247  ORF Transcript_144125/g.254247 Transcript_144125/m.254247 type:complete len:238 (-) Transcript_144125:86-799(-)